jgi:heme exporter protein A
LLHLKSDGASPPLVVTTAPALEIDDVSKRYGPRWAVARLSYTLAEGTSLLLTGHNGCGKTTLLKMIATTAFPTAGAIRVFGQDTRKHREALRWEIGLLSHASFLYDDLSAKQNLSLLARMIGLPGARQKVDTMLERVGLAERADSPVRQFSAGMRKRLAIGRLLLKAPRLALLDEPFGELDPGGILQMEKLIQDLQAEGTTVILATHLIEQGRTLSQLELHMENGRQVETPT